MRDRAGDLLEAPDTMMEGLRNFFRVEFWTEGEAAEWDPRVLTVQRRRNAVHAFRERDLGTHADYLVDVRRYLGFLGAISDRLPYP